MTDSSDNGSRAGGVNPGECIACADMEQKRMRRHFVEYCHGFVSLWELNYDQESGLLPAVVQHHQTGQVLMVGYMNQDAMLETLRSGLVTFYSRKREKLWTKGEESGNFLHVRSICCDCDKDCVLVLARPDGPTCHRGTPSCFDASPLPEAAIRYVMDPRNATSLQYRPEGDDRNH